jgi:V8-like Glu-specific endopeptidase
VLRLVLVALLLLPAAATAEAAERRMLDAEEAARFEGVGRLNIAGSRFCTATLVAPDVIVTAAHCLFHPLTGARVADGELRFVAGYRIRDRAALRRVTRTVVDPGYTFESRATYAGVGADLALGRLDRPVPEAVVPFATAALADRGPLAIVSYGQDRPHAPSIEAPCGIVERTDPVLALDCAVTYGASGSPLFQGAPGQGEAGDLRLVGVVSAMGRLIRPAVDVTFARTFARLPDALAPLLATLDAAPAAAPGAASRPQPRP